VAVSIMIVMSFSSLPLLTKTNRQCIVLLKVRFVPLFTGHRLNFSTTSVVGALEVGLLRLNRPPTHVSCIPFLHASLNPLPQSQAAMKSYTISISLLLRLTMSSSTEPKAYTPSSAANPANRFQASRTTPPLPQYQPSSPCLQPGNKNSPTCRPPVSPAYHL
jgi:hypothetical protein